MSKELVKQDIGFLEYPLWFQDDRMAEKSTEGYIWQDREGYVYRAGYKPPVRIDRLLLLYLTLKSQKEGWKEDIELSRFEILSACQLGTSVYWYQRLEDSLERWKMIGIKFQGTFYDGKTYQTMNFGIIDDWEIEKESKKLKVRFSPRWLQQQQHSNFFKYIDFVEFAALRSSLATRLYEILIKTFQGREQWDIDALKLAEKIPMKEKYPADVIPKIKASVNRINERTSFQLSLGVRRPERGKAIFEFRKLSAEDKQDKVSDTPKVMDVPEEKREGFEQLLELIPEGYRQQKTIVEAVSRTLRKHSNEYVSRNILYANEHAETNYRAYLSKALKKDWAAEEQPEPQEVPLPKEQRERREPTEEEVEAEFQARLGQMETVEVELRVKQARVELAKERVEKEPNIHPNDISKTDVQVRLFEQLREEVHRILTNQLNKSH